jgi:23S rRNA (uridine2552-2'-O)-methyltransferase
VKKNPYRGADHFTKKAKAAGFPARSVFKLEEIDRRVQLLKRGDRVLDLGCAPGSWTLYAAQKVAPGSVRGIDLQPVTISLPSNAEVIVGDFLAASPEVTDFLGKCAPYDVILSDMAPNTTGDFSDKTRSAELVRMALAATKNWLREGGKFVAKFFMSNELPEIRAEMRKIFEQERILRPETTRSESTEVFLVGLKKRAM